MSDMGENKDNPQQAANSVPATPPAPTDSAEDGAVNWQAQEYFVGEKNRGWYVWLVLVSLAFIALDVFFVQSWTFSALVIVMAVAIMVYSNRPPRIVNYTLSRQGLHVGGRLHGFGEFKSFGLVREDQQASVMLIPVKRFSFGVSVYFQEEFGEKIVDFLGARLPMEDLKLDFIDRIVRRLRL